MSRKPDNAPSSFNVMGRKATVHSIDKRPDGIDSEKLLSLTEDERYAYSELKTPGEKALFMSMIPKTREQYILLGDAEKQKQFMRNYAKASQDYSSFDEAAKNIAAEENGTLVKTKSEGGTEKIALDGTIISPTSIAPKSRG